MTYITTASTYTIGRGFGVRLTINQPTTGLITIADGGTTVGIIAVGTAAQSKDYWGFTGAITVTNASAENITVNTLNRQP